MIPLWAPRTSRDYTRGYEMKKPHVSPPTPPCNSEKLRREGVKLRASTRTTVSSYLDVVGGVPAAVLRRSRALVHPSAPWRAPRGTRERGGPSQSRHDRWLRARDHLPPSSSPRVRLEPRREEQSVLLPWHAPRLNQWSVARERGELKEEEEEKIN